MVKKLIKAWLLRMLYSGIVIVLLVSVVVGLILGTVASASSIVSGVASQFALFKGKSLVKSSIPFQEISDRWKINYEVAVQQQFDELDVRVSPGIVWALSDVKGHCRQACVEDLARVLYPREIEIQQLETKITTVTKTRVLEDGAEVSSNTNTAIDTHKNPYVTHYRIHNGDYRVLYTTQSSTTTSTSSSVSTRTEETRVEKKKETNNTSTGGGSGNNNGGGTGNSNETEVTIETREITVITETETTVTEEKPVRQQIQHDFSYAMLHEAMLLAKMDGVDEEVKFILTHAQLFDPTFSEAEHVKVEDGKPIDLGETGSKFLWPVPGIKAISSVFGTRKDPITGQKDTHNGLDIPAATGTSVVAAEDGKVVVATFEASAGNFIILEHANNLKTRYLHLSKIDVKVGALVKRGDRVGAVGTTGRSTGPHLHFEVLNSGTPVDPLPFLTGNGGE